MLIDLIKSDSWKYVEEEFAKRMKKILDIDVNKSFEDIAIEALANQRARGIINEFLEDMRLMKDTESINKQRSFK